MIAIIDYGVGNLFSLKSSLESVGADAVVTGDEAIIKSADKIVLPGVGAFRDAADKLKKKHMDDVVHEMVQRGKPLLGICLGMQLLFEKSYEYGEYDGLGLLKGNIRPIADVIPKNLSIPHIGWNSLDIKKASPLYENVDNGEYVYFVHSYYAADCDECVAATADYGAPLTASVEHENVFGCQFHPEKSGKTGMKILKAFCSL